MARRSVALTAFRGEEFLAAQLDSILRQSLPPDEIVLSDDSPDDATRQAVAPLLAAHPEIRYPVRADVTLRRRQQFHPAPGSTIQVTVNGKTTSMQVPSGPLTIPGIVFADSKPVTLLLEQ